MFDVGRRRSLDRKVYPFLAQAVRGDADAHASEDGGFGPYTVAVATDVTSQSYFNLTFPTFETLVRTAAGLHCHADGVLCALPVADKSEMWAYTAGPLKGGDWSGPESAGASRQARNVLGLHVVPIDLDKGYATLPEAHARLVELNWLGGAHVTSTHMVMKHKIPWRTRKFNRKAGALEERPGAFADFCKGNEPSDELASLYAIEIEGYNPGALGTVRLGELLLGDPKKAGTDYYVVHHGPLPKIRVLIAVPPFLPMPGEGSSSFKTRWQKFYHTVAQTFRVPYDRSCDTPERGYFGITLSHALGTPTPPLIHRGAVLQHDDLRLVRGTLPSSEGIRSECSVSRKVCSGVQPRTSDEGHRKLWRGFRAADAAVDLWDDVTDKRAEKGLVSIECPFIDEHVTSNKPGTRQCALFNARHKHDYAHARCFADSCQERSAEEFFEALFTPAQRHKYR